LALAEIGLAKALTCYSVPVSGLKARSYFAIAAIIGFVINNPNEDYQPHQLLVKNLPTGRHQRRHGNIHAD